MTTHGDQRHSHIVDDARRSIYAWRDRIRDPALSVLLVLDLCAIFFAGPLAAKGLPIARVVADTLVLAALVIVVMLSQKWDAIIVILLGLAATAASFLLKGEWSPVSTIVLRGSGNILAFCALTWTVARAVYACVGHETVVPGEDEKALPRLVEALFAFMQRNSAHLTEYFKLPVEAVVEIGREVSI